MPRNADAAAWAVVVAALLAVTLPFADDWRAMAALWAGSDTFGHGMLVAPIAVWLAWRDRAALAATTPRADPLGLLALAAVATAWIVADLAGVAVAAQYAAVAMIPAALCATAGRGVVRRLAFPLGFLFFMVPAGESLNPLLMDVTAAATVHAIAASGVPVVRDGLHFTLPTGRWSVVEACSGLRYLLAAAVLSTLFARLNFSRPGPRLLFVASALAVAVLANWLRAYTVVMVGHATDMRRGLGDEHVLYGWAFFGLVMATVFAMGLRWRDPPAAVREPATRARRARGARGDALRASVAAAAVAATLPWGALVVASRLADVRWAPDAGERIAAALGDASAVEPAVAPRFHGARAALAGRLDAAPDVDVYVGYFARQRDGHEMIAWGNAVVAESDPTWTVVSRTDTVAAVGALSLPVVEWRLRAASGERLLWSWYTVGGRHATGDAHAKLLAALGLATGRGDHSTVSVLGVALDPVAPSTASTASTASDPAAGPADALSRARARLAAAAIPVAAAAAGATLR